MLDESTVDPLTWYLLLASRGEAGDALGVVGGWGGDAYVAYRDGGRVCTAMAVTGDDPAATERFATALEAWAAAGPAEGGTVAVVDGAVEVRACDPGPDAPATGVVSEDLLAVPFLRADIESSLIASGSTADQARCSSRAVLDRVPIDALTAATLDPDVQRRVAEAMASCA